MTRKIASLALAIAMTFPAAAALAAPGGRLGTMPQGSYLCSTPGDAEGAAWVDIPGGGFTINTASTYHTAEGSGTYLLTGTRVTFTRGPLKGQKFERTGNVTLRWIDQEGNPGRVRCVRTGSDR